MDALLLRGDESASARSTMLALYVLADAPDWTRLLEVFDRASRTVPRLRQRVITPAAALSLPYWIVDAQFDLTYHVRRVRAPGAGELRELLDLAQVLAAVPLDPARPLWEATLVEGLEPTSCGGRAALLVKSSHAVGDGVAGMVMALALFDGRPDPVPPRPMPSVPPPDDVGPAAIARMELRQWPAEWRERNAEAARKARRAMGSAARHPVIATTSALEKAGTGVRWARSLVRVLGPTGPRSPAWQARGQRRRYSVLDVSLDGLRQAGRVAGGSVNDAYVAAVLGGIRRYHEACGSAVDEIAMAVPVNTRTGDAAASGNRFAGARFAGPAGEPDPAARIRRVHHLIAAGRAEPALDAVRTFAPIIARLPGVLLTALTGLAMTHDVQVSNIAGYPAEVYLAGQPVLRLYPFGPVPGVAAMIVLVSHVGACYVGVHVDLDAISRPELFDTCLREGFAEVLALADGPPTTGGPD